VNEIERKAGKEVEVVDIANQVAVTSAVEEPRAVNCSMAKKERS